MHKVVPDIIEDNERLLRTAYAPMHFSHSGKLRPSCLKPYLKEPDEDDPSRMNNKISVTRLDYSGWRYCINHGFKYQNDRKQFKGFLKLIAGKVRNIGLQPRYKPTEDNPFHANIVYPEIIKPHEDELDELESSKLQAIARELLDSGEYIPFDIAESYANLEEQQTIETKTVVENTLYQSKINNKDTGKESVIKRIINLLHHISDWFTKR